MTPLRAVDHVATLPSDGSRYELDDVGNAQRFADSYAGRLLYVASWQVWLYWDGMCWVEDEHGRHIELAKASAREILEESHAERDDARRKVLLRHAHNAAHDRGIRATVRLARSDPRIAVTPSELDADAWTLNTTTGLVDLRTGQLRAHDPAARCMHIAAGGYDPTAKAPLWMRFVGAITSGDLGRAIYLQRLAGVSLVGQVLEHVLILLVGSGANGKTVFQEVTRRVFGSYGHASPAALLLDSRDRANAPTPDLAALRGKRLVTVSETSEDGRLAIERIKALTSSDIVKARRIYGHPETFLPAHTVWVATNHRPRVADSGPAIWRRLRLIPFDHVVPEAERDAGLTDALLEEADGILTWAIQGCLDYQRDGLAEPMAVRAATDAYRADEDTFTEWLDEATTSGIRAPAADLQRSYAAWSHERGAKPLSSAALKVRLEDAGYAWSKNNRGAGYAGLALREPGDAGGVTYGNTPHTRTRTQGQEAARSVTAATSVTDPTVAAAADRRPTPNGRTRP